MLGMLGDKKKIVQLILAESPSREKEVPQGLEGDFSPAMEAYASDMIAAIKGDDAKGLASALKEFLYACEQEDQYVESDEQAEV